MVVDGVKITFDVPLNEPFNPCEVSLNLGQCRVTAPVRSKTMRMFRKIAFIRASRRSLGRVSVPMWPVTLSGRLLIVALVGRYPANWLIRRGSISPHLGFSHRTMRYCALMRY